MRKLTEIRFLQRYIFDALGINMDIICPYLWTYYVHKYGPYVHIY